MEFTANALLAVGARPLMSACPEEIDEIVSKCDSLLVNIGCVDAQQLSAMMMAVDAAKRYGKPWVLDPVGNWLTQFRADACSQLININPPTVIKGNKQEMNFTLQGPVLIQTGAVDVITQGERRVEIPFGNPIMAQLTATGCVCGAIVAAFLAWYDDPFQASVDAMTLICKAGENAAAKCKGGTGTFKTLFLDELCRLS